MSALTLCMIVRDEAAFLADCLDSVAGLVDSIVVVDTGSTDASVAIAEARGAKVVHHPWDDDFSAARNAALPHVARSKGRYLIVLDADERLAPGAAAAIRKAIRRADFDLGLLPLHDATSIGASPADVVSGRARRGEPVLLPRILRFDETLRWEGRVHEQVTTWSRAPGRRIAHVEAAIVHYGAIPEVRATRGKAERNRRLLERRAQEEPSNPNVRAYLAREYDRGGDPERAYDEARASWRALTSSAGEGAPPCDAVLPATVMAYYSIRHGDLEGALSTIVRARAWTKPHPNIELLSGLAHERRALAAQDVETFATELSAARTDYERCLSLRGQRFAAEVLPGACGPVGATRLASVLLLLGEAQAARTLFEAVLRDDPRHVEAALGRAEARIDGEEAAQALRELEPLLSEDSPDAWTLSAAGALAFGDRPTARLFADKATTAAQRKPWIGAWRRGRLQELRAGLAEAGTRETLDVASPTGLDWTATVVIPCFNRFDLLGPVLAGFVREKRARDFQIVLVDDGSEPPLADFLRSLGIEHLVDLVRRPNGGRGAALNDGLARATGDVVIFCDSDIVPTPGFVDEHLEFHRAHPSELATHLGALEWGVDAGLYGALVGARANPRIAGGERDVDWTQWFTDNWSCKRSLLASRGLGFDLAYRAWGFEELDLARGLVALGATNRLTLRAKGLHLKPATSEGMRACFVRSVPNLFHLARKFPGDPHVREWLAAHASEDAVVRVERAYEIVWGRVRELDAGDPDVVRDRNTTCVRDLAIALSDATFHVGIARGLVEHAAVVTALAGSLAAADGSVLGQKVEEFARKVVALERRLDIGASPWLADVASELGWDEATHPLRSRWRPDPVAAA